MAVRSWRERAGSGPPSLWEGHRADAPVGCWPFVGFSWVGSGKFGTQVKRMQALPIPAHHLSLLPTLPAVRAPRGKIPATERCQKRVWRFLPPFLLAHSFQEPSGQLARIPKGRVLWGEILGQGGMQQGEAQPGHSVGKDEGAIPGGADRGCYLPFPCHLPPSSVPPPQVLLVLTLAMLKGLTWANLP